MISFTKCPFCGRLLPHTEDWLAHIKTCRPKPIEIPNGETEMPTKDECDKAAQENWALARQADREGNEQMATEARRRAIEWEKGRDSILHRWFGW